MERLKSPNELCLTGNVSENWRKFKQGYEIYEIAAKIDKEDDKVRAFNFLHVAGVAAHDIYETFTWTEPGHKFVKAKIFEQFDAYCNPRKNITYERHIFFTRNLKEGEKIDQYVTDLKTKAKNCEFGDLQASLIRDRIICGIRNDHLRERLLRESDLTLEKCIEFCRAAEASEMQIKELGDSHGAKQVHGIKPKQGKHQAGSKQKKKFTPEQKSQGARPKEYRSNDTYKCKKCGCVHKPRNCPAYGKMCLNCHKMGHFAKRCKQQVNAIDTDSDENDYFVGTVSDKHKSTEWHVKTKISDQKVTFKLDTGASCNVLPLNVAEQLNIKGIQKTRSKLVSYSGHKIETVGKADIAMDYKGLFHIASFNIVKSKFMPVLGLETCVEMGLIQRLNTVQKEQTLFEKYTHLFSGLGCLPGEYKIALDGSVPAVIHPPRKIPHMLTQKVKEELDRMEKQGVISKVTKPTKWVNSMVVVRKPTGAVRICLDPRDLNKAVKREHFPMKTVEEVAAKLQDAKVFTTLDAAQGYFHIKLAEESTWLTTFNTPHGRYKYNRLPFGIVSASEVFQRTTSQIFEDIPGCDVIVDDILIWGKNDEELDARLEAVLEKADSVDLRFNVDKCKFNQTEVNYVGHTFGADGLKPSSARVKAILEMTEPKDVKDLQRLLGMINYLQKFIPKLATVNTPLHELLKKDIAWHWDHKHQHAFEQLKDLISQAPVLQYYSREEEVTVSVDASSTGLGGCLMQNGKPIAFASRTLNSAERNYAQIEKEMLAIVFGATRFHQYIYGKDVVNVQTDHKPLESLFRKSLIQAPQRIQRMMLKVQTYNLCVKYVPGKELFIADTLSRAPTKDFPKDEEFEIHSFVSITDGKAEDFIHEVDNDPILSYVKQYVIYGWPENRKDISDNLDVYWNIRDELNLCDGLLMKGDRIITPTTLQGEMIDKVHASHLGFDRCLELAKTSLFWIGMSKDIKNKVENCAICQKHRNYQQKESVIQEEIPDRPWQKLASDIFYLGNEKYMILADYYSKYFEISNIPDVTSTTVIKYMKSHFARHGIPEVLRSDNGPEYSSAEFKAFMSEYNIRHVTSSPRYPQSNGFAERTVQTAKRLIKKAKEDGRDPEIALLELRNTPVAGVELSPVEILMGRKTRSLIPIKKLLLKPRDKSHREIQKSLAKKQETQKKYYNRGCRDLPKVEHNEHVRMHSGKSWKPAKCVDEGGTPRSYILQSEGRTFRRNRRDILKTPEKFSDEVLYQKPYSNLQLPVTHSPLVQPEPEPLQRHGQSVRTDTSTGARHWRTKQPTVSVTKDTPVVSVPKQHTVVMETPPERSGRFSRVSGRQIRTPKRFEN